MAAQTTTFEIKIYERTRREDGDKRQRENPLESGQDRAGERHRIDGAF